MLYKDYRPKQIDVAKALQDLFRFMAQDIMSESSFRDLTHDLCLTQGESYAMLVQLWEEHGYIKVWRQPGQERYIEIGASLTRNYGCFM